MDRLLPLLLAVAVVAGDAWADGKVFAARAKVAIPDQSALLVWRDGVETLVIETAFDGRGEEFAWIVPLPSVPEIAPATRGLFPTLRALTAPEVLRGTAASGPLPLLVALLSLAGALGGLAIAARRNTPAVARAIAGGLGVLFAATLLSRCALLVPKGALEEGGVTVHARGGVGAYDTAVLSGRDAAGVVDWLDGHGFLVPADTRPALDAYAREGWVFAAARLRRDANRDTRATHPLAFTFEADRPVYPLRLTGTGQEALSLDLWVCGDTPARAPGLEPWFSDRFGEEGLPLRHAGLRGFVGDAPWITWLRGELAGTGLARDLEIAWTDDGPRRKTFWSDEGARDAARAAALLVAVVAALVLLWWIDRGRRFTRAGALRGVLAAVLAIVVAAAGVLVALPTVESTDGPSIVERVDANHALAAELDGSPTLAEARRRLEAFRVEERAAGRAVPIEGDLPHGVLLRDGEDGPELVVHGRWGGERRALQLADGE